MQDLESFVSPRKKDNQLFQSRYFTHSEKKIDNPQTYHNFFNDHPFEKFYQDISTLKPVLYDYPYSRILDRSFVVVDEKVTYGKPVSQQELEEMRAKRKQEPEVVTWGKAKDVDLKLKVAHRDTVEIEKEAESSSFCWCCAPTPAKKNILVQDI